LLFCVAFVLLFQKRVSGLFTFLLFCFYVLFFSFLVSLGGGLIHITASPIVLLHALLHLLTLILALVLFRCYYIPFILSGVFSSFLRFSFWVSMELWFQAFPFVYFCLKWQLRALPLVSLISFGFGCGYNFLYFLQFLVFFLGLTNFTVPTLCVSSIFFVLWHN